MKFRPTHTQNWKNELFTDVVFPGFWIYMMKIIKFSIFLFFASSQLLVSLLWTDLSEVFTISAAAACWELECVQLLHLREKRRLQKKVGEKGQ